MSLAAQVFRDAKEVGSALSGGTIAIGNFDGLHRGHQALFDAAKAHSPEGKAGVLTFEPHPVRVLAPHFAPPQILTLEEKIAGVVAHGIDVVVVHPFNADFASLSPSAFVESVLVRWLKVGGVVVGEDFSFGAKGAGDVDELKRRLAIHNVDVTVVKAVTEGNLTCSSTKVREFIHAGNMDAAQLLLGHNYWLAGEVVQGDGRGRTINVPTANVAVTRDLKPKFGVYATWAVLDDGRRIPSVTNVGMRPTFAGETNADVRIEAHLLDFDADLYGQTLRLEFVDRLRAEEKFKDRTALVAQIQRDIEAGRDVLTRDRSN